MSQHIIVNPRYTVLRGFIESLPLRFSNGRLLYSGRNEIRSFLYGDKTLVVKRFGEMNLIKKVIYTFFRSDKAIRSYNNSLKLLQRGIATPEPFAYIAIKRHGLLDELYYVSAETKAKDVKSELIEREPYNEPLMKAYATFVALLHDKGILHRDLNPTNVLYEQSDDGNYTFSLIDVNRMTFYDGPVPKAECMENLTLFWWLTPVYRAVLKVYADKRGWTQADIDRAIRVKERHDKRWIRRKNFTAIFKHKKLNQL